MWKSLLLFCLFSCMGKYATSRWMDIFFVCFPWLKNENHVLSQCHFLYTMSFNWLKQQLWCSVWVVMYCNMCNGQSGCSIMWHCHWLLWSHSYRDLPKVVSTLDFLCVGIAGKYPAAMCWQDSVTFHYPHPPASKTKADASVNISAKSNRLLHKSPLGFTFDNAVV